MLPIVVVVANRNNARYLEKCLESILGQSAVPDEIVVVDDGSTDDSRQLLQWYQREKKILLLCNDQACGPAASRALAIAASKSPFLTTLDADDFYRDHRKLEAETQAIGGMKKGRLAFSDVMLVTKKGDDVRLVSEYRRIREGDLSERIRYLRGFIPRDYVVARSDYLEAGGYDTSLRLYEDWDLKIRLSDICEWRYSGHIGTAYRANPRGLSGAPKGEHVRVMRRIFRSNCRKEGRFGRGLSILRFAFFQSLFLRWPAL